jgi:hypothetical protein
MGDFLLVPPASATMANSLLLILLLHRLGDSGLAEGTGKLAAKRPIHLRILTASKETTGTIGRGGGRSRLARAPSRGLAIGAVWGVAAHVLGLLSLLLLPRLLSESGVAVGQSVLDAALGDVAKGWTKASCCDTVFAAHSLTASLASEAVVILHVSAAAAAKTKLV